MDSLDNVSSRTDFTKSTDEEIEQRQKMLAEIIEETKNRKQAIDENYLLYHMRLKGYLNYTRNKLYNDRLALDSDNNYLRDFLPRYSRYQEDIANSLNEIERQCIELYEQDWKTVKTIIKQTKDGKFRTKVIEKNNYKPKAKFLEILNKTAELKQKHCEGQNIQIGAVIIQKELQSKKAQLYQKDEIIKKLEKIKQSKTFDTISNESEKKK